MTRRRQAIQVRQDRPFKGRQFTAVILWAVRWYLMFPISYRDLELMLLDRGVEVDHTTISRWIQAYAAELEKRIRPHLHVSNGSWRVDETCVKVKGRWMPGFPNKPAGASDGQWIFGCEGVSAQCGIGMALSFGCGCTAGESGFEALQPPRVRYPMGGHGEASPPDQVAGGRTRNAVRSAAADHPDGPQASARMV